MITRRNIRNFFTIFVLHLASETLGKNPGISLTKTYRLSHLMSCFVSQKRLNRVFRNIPSCSDCFFRTFGVVTGERYERENLNKITVVSLDETYRLNYEYHT